MENVKITQPLTRIKTSHFSSVTMGKSIFDGPGIQRKVCVCYKIITLKNAVV